MNESLLIKICVASVIVGILMMFLSAKLIKPEITKIVDVSEKQKIGRAHV